MLFSFKNLNPYMNLLYFLSVIVTLYSTDNPIVIATFLIMTIIITLRFCNSNFIRTVKVFAVTALLVIIINPLVSHRGMTILFYIGYTPITLESVFYGIIAGVKLFTILLMGSYFNIIMDYEKLAYVLAPLGNNLSLILSLSVKFIPEYLEKIKNIKDTQKTKGIVLDDKNKVNVAKSMTHILNAFFFITLEQGVITIKSIKSRGYLNREKKVRRDIRFRIIDYIFVSILTLFIVVNISLSKITAYEIYPELTMPNINLSTVLLIMAYILFLGAPIWFTEGEKLYLAYRTKERDQWMQKGKKI